MGSQNIELKLAKRLKGGIDEKEGCEHLVRGGREGQRRVTRNFLYLRNSEVEDIGRVTEPTKDTQDCPWT